MNIVEEKLEGLVSTIRIDLGKEDYQEKVDKLLKNYQKNASMPGFRPGKVPMGVVKKMYGKAVIVDEVNKILIDSIYEYLRENKIEIIGNALPNEELTKDIDFDSLEDFTFFYDLGIVPGFEVELEAINGVTRHVIVATDEEIEKELDRIRKRFGDVSHPEQTNAESWFTAEFAEFDADDKLKPEGKADMVTIYMNALRKKETVEKLTGLKPVDFMILDLKEDFEDENEYRHTFSLGKENLEDFGPKVRITVHEISEIIPAELNEELFVEAFDEKVTTLDEAKVEIRRSIENQYKADSDRVFFNDVIGKIMENPNVEFSTGFLKRWLVATHENPMNEDELQKEADSTVNPLKWHLIRKKIINGNDLEVTENEIKKYAEIMLVRTMLQYRQMIPEKKELEGMVDRLLQKDKQRDEIFEKLMEFKMIDLFIKKVPAEILEMSFAEFLDKMNSRAREHIHDENCDHDHDHSH